MVGPIGDEGTSRESESRAAGRIRGEGEGEGTVAERLIGRTELI